MKNYLRKDIIASLRAVRYYRLCPISDLQKQIIFSLYLFVALTACTEGTNETIESAYQLPILQEPAYKFTRNGESCVNLLECEFLKSPVDIIFSRYLNRARIGTPEEYSEMLEFYKKGEFGLKPIEEIASSTTHSASRAQVLQDFTNWFESSKLISQNKGNEAVKGRIGYVGNNHGDKDIFFVDGRGIAVAEVYRFAAMGALYLDKILNVHLNKEVLFATDVREGHELTHLLPGHNYTEMEHHWDLAYGYYDFWKSLAQSGGLPALRDSHLRIFRSFVWGRTYMETSRYKDIELRVDTIRHELSRVVAVRAMHLLTGANTFSNLKENPKYAFRLLSQAYGLIYASQFARNAQGRPFLTYDETQQLLHVLERDGGLWDSQRLMGSEQDEGSLRQLAAQLGAKFGISPKEIEK